MMRLIDADELKKLILEERDKIPFTVPAAPYEFVKEKANTHGNAVRGGIRKALRCMEQTPTIEAEPVRHGKWINQDDTYTRWYCSECKSRNHPGHENFCPNCGTKMDLEG
jgi:hypothetical protein